MIKETSKAIYYIIQPVAEDIITENIMEEDIKVYWVRHFENRNDYPISKKIYNRCFNEIEDAVNFILEDAHLREEDKDGINYDSEIEHLVKEIKGYFTWEWKRKNNFDMWWITQEGPNDHTQIENIEDYDDNEDIYEFLEDMKCRLMNIFS